MANVRHATEADIPRLLQLGEAMVAEAPALRHAAMDRDKVAQTLRFAFVHGVVVVHEGADGIDGLFVGLYGERWFSKHKALTDLALYVTPDKRGGSIAFRLIRRVLAWAQSKQIDPRDVIMGVSTGVKPEITGRFYEAMGFEQFGGLFRLKGY